MNRTGGLTPKTPAVKFNKIHSMKTLRKTIFVIHWLLNSLVFFWFLNLVLGCLILAQNWDRLTLNDKIWLWISNAAFIVYFMGSLLSWKASMPPWALICAGAVLNAILAIVWLPALLIGGIAEDTILAWVLMLSWSAVIWCRIRTFKEIPRISEPTTSQETPPTRELL